MQKAWFWIENFSPSQILNQLFSSGQIFNQVFFVLSHFDSTFSQRVKIWIKNFTTRQILNRNNLPKSTTCTFHIAFLHITMNSHNPQFLRHLDNGIRHHSSKTFCTLFRKDFHFWFRYGTVLQLYSFYLTHVWLVFEKRYDKMKHVK